MGQAKRGAGSSAGKGASASATNRSKRGSNRGSSASESAKAKPASTKSSSGQKSTGKTGTGNTRSRTSGSGASASAGRDAVEPRRKRVTRKQTEEEAKKYRRKADKYKNDPEATDELLRDAQAKAKKHKGPLSGRFDDIMTLIRMVRAYFKGEYRDVPWETIALAIGALIYFLSPVDLIPDPIPLVGYVDDAAVIGFVVASTYTDLNNFRDWEEEHR